VVKLALVPSTKSDIKTLVPGDYFRDHSVAIPAKRIREYVLLGIAAIALHGLAAWVLTLLPPAVPLKSEYLAPVEITIAKPEVPPPTPPEPPKPKVLPKAAPVPKLPVVQHVDPTVVGTAENVVAVQQGPVAPAAPVAEEPVIGARADASYLNNPLPQYPAVALRQGWQGTVQVRVLVLPDGRPGSIKLEKTSGKKVLDDAALAAVQSWRFVPAKRGAESIEGWVSFPVEFNLES